MNKGHAYLNSPQLLLILILNLFKKNNNYYCRVDTEIIFFPFNYFFFISFISSAKELNCFLARYVSPTLCLFSFTLVNLENLTKQIAFAFKLVTEGEKREGIQVVCRE